MMCNDTSSDFVLCQIVCVRFSRDPNEHIEKSVYVLVNCPSAVYNDIHSTHTESHVNGYNQMK